MAKRGPTYICQACGAVYHRWQGKCEACGAWSSLSEEAQAAPVPGANDVQLPPSGFAETPKPATSPATYPVKVSAREGKS